MVKLATATSRNGWSPQPSAQVIQVKVQIRATIQTVLTVCVCLEAKNVSLWI